MNFNKNNFFDESVEIDGEKLSYRAYRDVIFADKPIQNFHRMNIYAPLAYFSGQSINGYTLKTAPIFMPNAVGGYCPANAEAPSKSNTIRQALLHGYVVASPAIRGRTLVDENGKYYGKAPACIVDYKAAVRFLHKFADEIPGNDKKIITNGTSAGGALSCLMGVTGNHPDYEKYLLEIGAAGGDDSIFAASCYCPIINLDNADKAYEWQFNGIYDCHFWEMSISPDGKPVFTPAVKAMSEESIQISREECRLFPSYLNSLNLVNENGEALTLDESGNGSFKEYIKSVILSSAQKAIDEGADLSEISWLEIKNGKATVMSFSGFASDITRMKAAPAFDDIALRSPENDLFGDENNNPSHFTAFSAAHSKASGKLAPEELVKLLNPMRYIDDERAKTAKYFRLRHGECDRDTSIAISAILNLKLKESGCNVDYAAPWNVPHSGDYDLPELFAWIDSICN